MRLGTLLRTRLDHLRNERLSRTQLEARQLTKFRRLVRFVQRRSPYYARVIAERKIDLERCTPRDFPVLTKRDVTQHFDELVTDRRVTREAILRFLERSRDPGELFLDYFNVVHTSGSSGEPGCFVFSPHDWTRGLAHGLRMHPFRPWPQRIAFFGATGGHYGGVSMVATGKRSINKLFFRIRAFEINSPLAKVIEGLNAFRPEVLVGYAMALRILGEQRARGVLTIAPRLLESSGEPLGADDRAALERTFGAPVFNVYSCTEHLVMGLSRPGDGGMYLLEDDLIFELEPDHTRVTNLFNRTLPLIRYRLEDVLLPLESAPGPWPFRKVCEIVGRNEHVPFFRNARGGEDFISPHIINEFFVPGLRRFQMRVLDATSFAFCVCLEHGIAPERRATTLAAIERGWREILAQKQLDNVRFWIEEEDDLPVDPKTGKFRLVVRPAQV